MAQPRNVHVNRPLTNISIALLNDAQDFVADKVFPIVPVSKQSDLYYIYEKDSFMRSDAQKRAPGRESAGSGYNLLTDSYRADVWAVHKDISDQERANSDEPLDADRDATEFLTHQMLIRREKQFVNDCFSTGIWTGSTSGTDVTPGILWSAAGSDPIFDISQEIISIKRKTGRRPNTMVVSEPVHMALKNNEAVLDRISGGALPGRAAFVTRELLAQAFEVDNYVVASAVENTALEGGTFAGAHIAGKNALLCYSEPSPGLMKPSAGYIFQWTGLLGGAAGIQISRFRMEHLKSDRVEAEMAWDMKVVSAELGAFFSGCIS